MDIYHEFIKARKDRFILHKGLDKFQTIYRKVVKSTVYNKLI